MKKIASIFFSFMAFALCLGASGCNSSGSNETSSNTDISIEGFVKEDEKLTGKVNNDVQSFSFIDKVSVAKGSTWKVYSDISGTQEIVTKTVNLSVGDNLSYILVTAKNGDLGFYNVNVRRLDIYTVQFNTNGGTIVEDQRIQEESLVNPVEDPTRSGFDFGGWDYDFSMPVMSDLTINALWAGHKHTISFDMNGADSSPVEDMDIAYGDYVSLPNPSKTGYSFKGWYYGASRISSGYWRLDEDVTLKAEWEGNQYKLNYNPNGGSVQTGTNTYTGNVYKDTVVFGEEFTLRNAKKTGYNLEGWFYDETKLESGTWLFPNDLTVVAKWTAAQYKITYDVNGGDELDSNVQYVSYDSPYTLKEPTRKGYTFLGWFNNGTKFESGTWNLTQDVNLTAKWEVNVYSVTLSNPSSVTHYYVNFDKNDGNGVYSTIEASANIPLTIPKVPTMSGKKFRGWFTEKECTNIFDFSSEITHSMTLFAGWYDLSSASGTSIDLNGSYQKITVQGGYKTSYYYAYLYIPKTQKYTINFEGYSSSSICTIDVTMSSVCGGGVYKTTKVGFVNHQRVEEQEIEINGKAGDLIQFKFYESYYGKNSSTSGPYSFYTNLKVACDPITSSATLSKEANSIPVKITYGSNYDLGIIDYTGFTFHGWFTLPNGQGVQLTSIDGKSIVPWQFTDVTTVYAYVTSDAFTITYNPNGGTLDVTTQSVSYNESYTLKTPVRTGYTFLGWYKNNELFESGVWKLTENVTLVAKWQVNSYSVNLSEISTANKYYLLLDKNDGTGVYDRVQINRSGASNYPTPCTRNGYIFTGWYKNSACSQAFDFSSSINADTTIFAGWRKVTVSNTNYNLVLNGGSYTCKCTNGGSCTIYFFTALSSGTYTLNYTATASTYLYFNDVDDGQSSHSYVASLNGTGTYSLSVIEGKTYEISFNVTQSSYTTGTTVTCSIKGTYPTCTVLVGDSPNLSLSINYGESFDLGIPDSRTGMKFVGWYTEANGGGTKLTDANGKSLAVWSFTSSINAYPYFVNN